MIYWQLNNLAVFHHEPTGFVDQDQQWMSFTLTSASLLTPTCISSQIKSHLSGQAWWIVVNGLYSTQRVPRVCSVTGAVQQPDQWLGWGNGSSLSLKLQKSWIEEAAQYSQGRCCHPVGPRQARGMGRWEFHVTKQSVVFPVDTNTWIWSVVWGFPVLADCAFVNRAQDTVNCLYCWLIHVQLTCLPTPSSPSPQSCSPTS